MAAIVTHARSTAEHFVQSLPVKASEALHAEITGSPGQADASGRCTSILNALISEEAKRKAKEITSFIDNAIDPSRETADAAEVSEDAKDEEHEAQVYLLNEIF